ncbi:O-antigen ligase family protein [Patescibacteria group bacterium]|nr:O-antigen ligase family protein [Patescibacteria group bacterium]
MTLISTLFFFLLYALAVLNGGISFAAAVLLLVSPVTVFAFLRLKRVVFRGSRVFVITCTIWMISLFLSFLSTLHAPRLDVSLVLVLENAASFLLFVYFYFSYDLMERRITAQLFIFIGFVLSIISMYFILFPPSWIFPKLSLVYASYGHNHLSEYLLLILPTTLFFCTDGRNKKKQAIWVFLFAFFVLNLFLTFSRAAVVVFFLMMLAILIRYLRGRYKRIIIGLCLLQLVVTILFVVVTSGGSRRNISLHFLSGGQTLWIHRQTQKPLSSETRPDYWDQAWRAFRSRPLTGYGPGSFKLVSYRFQRVADQWSWFAHSLFFQSLAELGISGTIALGLLMGFPLIFLVRTHLARGEKKLSLESALMIGIAGVALHGLVDFTFSFPAVWLSFWVVVAILMKKAERNTIVLPRITTMFFSLASVLLCVAGLAHGVMLWKLETMTLRPVNEYAWPASWFLRLYPYEQNYIDEYVLDVSGQGGYKLLLQARPYIRFFVRDDAQIDAAFAEAYVRNGEPDGAIFMYKKVLSENPTDQQNYFKLAMLYRSLRETRSELDVYTLLFDRNPAPETKVMVFTSLHELGNSLYNRGNLSDLFPVYRFLLLTDPDHEEILRKWYPVVPQAQELISKGKFVDAVRLVRQYVGMWDGVSLGSHENQRQSIGSALYFLAHQLYEKGDLAGAAGAISRALTYLPHEADYYRAYASYLLAQGRLDELISARDTCSRRISYSGCLYLFSDPSWEAYWSAQAVIEISKHKINRAVRATKLALVADPWRGDLYVTLGLLFKFNGDHQNAVKYRDQCAVIFRSAPWCDDVVAPKGTLF